MKKAIKSFADKKFRYGAFSTLICIIVIAALAFVNLIVSLFDIKYDLTLDKRYSISQQSRDIISEVTEDITIYALFKTGTENLQYESLLNEYAAASNHINVVYRDPYLNPAFVERYKAGGEDIPANSIIVEGPKRFIVLREDELYTTEFDYNTYRSYIKSIDVEPMVSNALRYVSLDYTPIIYQVINHNEPLIPESIAKQLQMANYELYTLNIFEEDIPSDADMLILLSPERDYLKEEADKVLSFLQSGGRALVMTDALIIPDNFHSIIEAYCVTHNKDFIIEGSRANHMSGYPYVMLPDLAAHEITDNLAPSTYIVTITSAGLSQTNAIRNSLKIEPLLITSADAYAKDGTSQTSTTEPEPGDAKGHFNLALAVTDSVYMPATVITKLVIMGSASYLDEEANSIVAGGNADFVLNCVNWLNDGDAKVYIPSKVNFTLESLIINDAWGNIIALCAMFGIPGALLIIGFCLWLRRRNR